MKLGPSHFRVGDEFEIIAEVYLGEIKPSEVEVEVYLGKIKGTEQVEMVGVERMEVFQENEGGNYIYKCRVKCKSSGRYGFNVRVVPSGDDYLKFTPHFITWGP